jgi:hypothetical protein
MLEPINVAPADEKGGKRDDVAMVDAGATREKRRQQDNKSTRHRPNEKELSHRWLERAWQNRETVS